MTSSMMLLAASGVMTPVVTDDMAYLGSYAYAMRVVADTATRVGKPVYGDHIRARAYHLRTLAR